MRMLFLVGLLASPALADVPAGYDSTQVASCVKKAEAAGQDADSCIGVASTACMAKPGGDTTVGMIDCLAAESGDWDRLMNDWYKQVMHQAKAADEEAKTYDSAAEAVAPMLKKAQQAWVSYRDASCMFQAERFQDGTAGGPAAATCLMELTGTQALRLRDLMDEQP